MTGNKNVKDICTQCQQSETENREQSKIKLKEKSRKKKTPSLI